MPHLLLNRDAKNSSKRKQNPSWTLQKRTILQCSRGWMIPSQQNCACFPNKDPVVCNVPVCAFLCAARGQVHCTQANERSSKQERKKKPNGKILTFPSCFTVLFITVRVVAATPHQSVRYCSSCCLCVCVCVCVCSPSCDAVSSLGRNERRGSVLLWDGDPPHYYYDNDDGSEHCESSWLSLSLSLSSLSQK